MMRFAAVALRLLAVCALVLMPVLGGAAPALAAAPLPDVRQDEPVDTLDEVESAVVQIEAVGTFVDPSEGRQQSIPGFGSGFIIDPSGIAVTNNHVVTGGALFKVFVAGRDRPVNARVLGASECYDVAVIDLQGDGYPYLSWYTNPVRVGLDVYAAGFPLGDPEFTLTRGVIAKTNADGESNWSSLDATYMHDATINPGNSGGPLVTQDGAVVGINYASDDSANQYFAIRGTDARSILDQLIGGADVESLGINGEARATDSGANAVYVYSVKSGSPADVAGIVPGDYILEIEGLPVGADGIMADYCDILASHDATDVLAIKVYRPDTGETLEGQINGRALEANISIAEQVDDSPAGADVAASATTYTYVPVNDEAGLIHIEAPDAWADVQERDWTIDDEVRGTQLLATSDLDHFDDRWDVPGVIFSYSPDLQEDFNPAELLDTIDYSDQCEPAGRTPLPDDAYFTGFYDEYNDCGGVGTTALVAAMIPKQGDYMLGIEVYAVTEADLDALDHILDTFYIGDSAAQVVSTNPGADILDLVDTSGLAYDYAFVNEANFSALLPADWTEIDTREWINDDGDKLGEIVQVAPDIDAYNNGWDAPGMQAYLITDAGDDFSVQEAMDSADFSDICRFDERVEDVQHTIYGVGYTGMYDVYTRCDNTDTIYYTGVFLADSKDHAYIIDFVSATEDDDDAFEVLLKSFFYTAAVQPAVNSDEFSPVSDESGRISLQAPAAWTDTESKPFEVEDDGVVGVEFTIAPDVDQFNDRWDVAGAFIAVWDGFGASDADDVLDTLAYDDNCTFDSRYEYEGDLFAGKYDLWNDCGGTEGATIASFALTSATLPDALVVMYIAMPTEQDLSVLEPILNTLRVTPAETAATPADIADAAAPAAPAAPAAADEPLVEILANTLNVRSGPGTNYTIIATVDNATVLRAIGQWNNCAWLKVEDGDGEQGWVSGDAQFTALAVPCASVPAAAAPSAPVAPAPAAPAAPASNQACITFKNQVGIEVNITLTRQGDNWNTTFTINKGQSGGKCVGPGKYTYTASTWDGRSLNGEVQLDAGDNYNIDLNPG